MVRCGHVAKVTDPVRLFLISHFSFRFSFFNLPVKVSAAILIDGHKLQLNTFFICLFSVAVVGSPHFRGVRLDSMKLK